MPGQLLLPSEPIQLPLLPLRDVVVFPHMVIPLFVGRPKSIKALEAAMETGKSVLLVAQKAAAKDEPSVEDLYEVGCIASILQMLKLPDGTVKVLVEGSQRAEVSQIEDSMGYFSCEATPKEIEVVDPHETEALRRAIMAQFDQYVKLNKKIPQEILASLAGIDDPSRLADTICAHLPVKLEQKQRLLEMNGVVQRLESLLTDLESEIDILQVEKRIRGRVKRQMEKSQREYYLNEQVKAIQKELGEGEEGADLEELEKRIKAARMPKEALKKAESELKKLKLMSPMSAEATVIRNFIDTLVNLPWRKKSKINNDLSNAEKVLNEDHYGLDKVKERILEYLAVQQRVDRVKAPILCLVGPPGVGKTSLARSIARSIGRNFVKISLGGVRDEAEIRGHRRTYIGALPGKLIQGMKKAQANNPVILLDEIDKICARENRGGADVSREGVQRDLLPLIEGTTVSTKYGMIKTDHILFIASGAFHLAKPSDLIPELQGRFPIRVELASLSVADFEQILTNTDACLTRQYEALIATEGVTLEFQASAIKRLAEIAWQVNEKTENIGARRLYTVMEKLLEEGAEGLDALAAGLNRLGIVGMHGERWSADSLAAEFKRLAR